MFSLVIFFFFFHFFSLGSKDNKLAVWDVRIGKYESVKLPESAGSPPRTNCGIHDLRLSPSKDLLCSGSSNPNDVALFETNSWKCNFFSFFFFFFALFQKWKSFLIST